MIETLLHWAEMRAVALAAGGASLFVQSTLLIATGLIAAACVRRRSAALQSLILRATLVAVLACPLAGWMLSRWGAETFHMALPHFGAYALLTAVAIAVGVLLLIRLLLAISIVRRIRQAAHSASVHWIDDAGRCARVFNLRTPPILQTDQFTTPCLVGFHRPVILLPTAAKTVRHDVLVHELAHLRRRDCLWHLFCHIARALLWFQPLMWVLARRIELSADEVCDDSVLAWGGDRADYARALIDIAEQHQMPWTGSACAVGMAAFKSNVSRRVVRIMDNTRNINIDLRRITVLLILTLTASATLLAALLGTSIPAALADNPPAAGARLPVPDAASAAKTEKVIRDVFGNYNAAPAAQRPAIAAKMMEEGIATANDPVARYVLLKDAGDLAASAGDAATAMRAATMLASTYLLDEGELKLALLRRAAGTAVAPTAAAAVATEGLNCANEAAAAGNYDLAGRFMLPTEQAARTAKNITLTLSIQSRAADIKWLQQEAVRAKTAQEKLAKTPTDPEANHTLGRYFCIVRGDWDHGLIGLSKGGNAAYHAAATADLAKPATGDKQVAAGDLWWDLAEKEPAGAAQRALRRRAGYWYSQAVVNPQFAGLSRALVEKRLGQVPPPGPGEAVAEVPPPAVQPNRVRPPAAAVDRQAKTFTNTVRMKFVAIEPGEFIMGSPAGEKDRLGNETQHRVKLSRGFMMACTPVTQSQWKSVMGSNPSYFQGDELPVETVGWSDAVAFCGKLGEKEGRKYRLPTEAEWEYACRAGTKTEYYTGDGETALKEAGWFAFNSGAKTHPVGQKKPNAWGLYDMHGNVWQWCSDYYGDYPTGDVVDPKGSAVGDKDASRVLRGGSFGHVPAGCRAAYRHRSGPEHQGKGTGFRVCLDTAQQSVVAGPPPAPAYTPPPGGNIFADGPAPAGGRNVLLFANSDSSRAIRLCKLVGGGNIRSVGTSEIVNVLANAAALGNTNVIVWQDNSLCDAPANAINPTTWETMRHFAEKGGDVVIFEQFRDKNWDLVEKTFGIRIHKGDGPYDVETMAPNLAAKVATAGISDDAVRRVRYLFGYDVPANSTVFARNKKNVAMAAAVPYGSGRVIVVGGNIAVKVDQAFDEVLFDYIYHISQGEVVAPAPAYTPPPAGNIFTDGPAPAVVAGLTAQLNDPTRWTIQKGTWHNAANKMHGEGDSEAWCEALVPRNVALSFRMNVIQGSDPRMDFYRANLSLTNIGAGQNLFPVLGPGAKLTTPPDGYVGGTRIGVPYANNQPRLMTFRFWPDRFAVEVDGKPTYAGTYTPGPDIRLQFHGGGKSGGITEFSDFRVEALTSSPAAPAAMPARAYTPPPGGNIFADGPAPAAGATGSAATGKKNILLFVGNPKEEALFRALPGANVRVVKRAETASVLARPDAVSGASIVVWGCNTFADLTEADFPPAGWENMLRLMHGGGDVVVFQQVGGSAERGQRIKAHWQFVETNLGAGFHGGPYKQAAPANAQLAAHFQAAGLDNSYLSNVVFSSACTFPANATVLVNGGAAHDIPVVVEIPVGKGRLILVGSHFDPNDEPLEKALFGFIYGAGAGHSEVPAPAGNPALPVDQQFAAALAKLKQANGGADIHADVRTAPDGSLQVDLKGQDGLVNLEPLSRLRISKLNLSHCEKLRSLNGLQGMPLTDLELSACFSLEGDLTALRGMRLTRLNLYACRMLKSLNGLDGSALTGLLDMTNCFALEGDLSALKGAQLTQINLRDNHHLQSLHGLEGMPLTGNFDIDNGFALEDISALKGMQLTRVSLLSCKNLRSLNGLQGMPLKELILPKHLAQGNARAILDAFPTLTSVRTGDAGADSELAAALKGRAPAPAAAPSPSGQPAPRGLGGSIFGDTEIKR
jgi:formylglycine-generating enzyme required for sulfatase activity/beta-lactamase regulating signal transducer with metallopeptidase domain